MFDASIVPTNITAASVVTIAEKKVGFIPRGKFGRSEQILSTKLRFCLLTPCMKDQFSKTVWLFPALEH